MAEIVPSLLSADFTRLQAEIEAVQQAGATRLHLDIMDGHFVPNITLGPFIVEAIRRITDLHLESHLMIQNPHKYIDAFIKAGSDTVIVHIEASHDPQRDIKYIKKQDVRAGLVLNPPTDFAQIEPYLSSIDHLLVMTVHPGFGGQTMITEALQKVRLARPFAVKNNFPIEVDGGINRANVRQVVAAGSDLLVAGSAVFSGGNPQSNYENLSRKLNQ